MIGHLDGLDMPEVHDALARRGVFVGFDRVGSERPDRPWESTATRVRNILKFLDAGHADHLILSSDFSAEENLKRSGGPGIALTLTRFVPKLREAGVDDATLRGVMTDNPRRLLAFVPRPG
jgi:phosphotriesterase-related protein